MVGSKFGSLWGGWYFNEPLGTLEWVYGRRLGGVVVWGYSS